MAPDLNSVPASPRTQPVSSPSQSQSPPTSRPPHHMTGTPLLPGVTGSNIASQDNTIVPVRHPRPLTAAELHLELEKEQEAVVNRLTRELSALRAQQSASVVSTTSSTSAADYPQGAQQPDAASAASNQTLHTHASTSSRRQRSSSSLSSRSNRSVTSQGASTTPSASIITPVTGISQASVDRARDAAGIGVGVNAGFRSRENSLAGMSMPMPSRSRAPSASPHPSPQLVHQGQPGGMDPMVAYFPSNSHRQSVSSTSSATARYEEAATARAALEVARKENEMLAARVRELEGMLRGRQSIGSREQSIGSQMHETDASRPSGAESKAAADAAEGGE